MKVPLEGALSLNLYRVGNEHDTTIFWETETIFCQLR